MDTTQLSGVWACSYYVDVHDEVYDGFNRTVRPPRRFEVCRFPALSEKRAETELYRVEER